MNMKESEPQDHSQRRKQIFTRVSNMIVDRAYNYQASYAGFFSRANGLTLNECDRLMGHTIISIEKESEEFGTKEEHDEIMQGIHIMKEALYPSDGKESIIFKPENNDRPDLQEHIKGNGDY